MEEEVGIKESGRGKGSRGYEKTNIEPGQITIIKYLNSTQEDERNVDQHKSHHGKEGKCGKQMLNSAPITIIDDSN